MQRKKRLRVAMVGSYPTNQAQLRGGVQAAFAYLARGLARIDDLELHILTLRQPGWAGPDRIERDGLTIHLLPPYPRFERLRNYHVYQSIFNRTLAQIQPAIVHAQEAASDALVAMRSGYPTVITAHGIRSEDAKYARSWSRRLRLTFDGATTERSVMRRVKHLIAISQYVTGYFARFLQPDINRYYIPNAIDERFFHLPGISGEPTILFAGSIIPRKRVEDLVLAFERVARRMPLAQLRIAGDCSSEPAYVESVRRQIDQSGLGDNVHLLGQLPETMVFQEFSGCELLVLPSSQETTPMVIAQAIAAGKPVVATRVGGVPEMLGENCERGFLVNVGDINGLTETILRLLQDPSLRAGVGQAGHAFALQNYHSDRVAQRTYEVYQNILTAERGKHG